MLLDRITLVMDGREVGRIERLAAFEIELDDGARVRVELGEQLVIEPVTSRRGTWRQLADAEIAELGS